jgi:Zn-dependent peptidase ImmA (M78 family)
MTASSYFKFSAAWPEGSEDVAEISLRVGERVISRIADTEKQTVRDYFRASSTGLALWLADNWWRLRWETIRDFRFPSVNWRLRHELNSASGGTLWPPGMIFSVGDRIAFAPSVGKNFVDGPQSYFDFKVGMVAADEYEPELDRLFEAVLGHCAKTVDGKALKTLLEQITTERQDPELAAWRRLEACLGFDPDVAPDEVVDALVKLDDVAGEDGVEEAAHAQPGASSAQSLSLAIEATRESEVEVDLSLAYSLKRDWNLPSYASPWQMAEAAAAELRSIIGVPRGLLKHDVFEDVFKARWDDLKSATATARKLPYGARIDGEKKSRAALQTAKPYDRRFELARQFGDAVWQEEASFGIISRAKTDRQKFQRAFAHGLLCPFDDLRRVLDVNDATPEAMKAAARRFGVHPSVVRTQLVYKGYLPFENTNEEAEAA